MVLTAEKVIRTVAEKPGKRLKASQAALMLMTPQGEVRAIVGGSDYASSQYNRALKAQRQPGSAFKPFIFLAALEAGYRPDTLVNDEPIRIDGWKPKNYKNEYRGDITLTDAFARSVNTVAVKLFDAVGGARVIATARRFGISSPLASNAALALGTSDLNSAR